MAITLIRYFNTEKNEGMEIKIFRDIRIGKISRYAWTLVKNIESIGILFELIYLPDLKI